MENLRMYLNYLGAQIFAAGSGVVALIFALGLLSTVMGPPRLFDPIDTADVEPEKRFTQNNYISTLATAELLQKDPDVLFVDVRDPVEIAISGHPKPIDAIVPVRIQGETFNHGLQEYALENNPDFLASMQQVLAEQGKDKSSMIIVTCGSGYRSSVAAQILVDAGYSDVWHIPDGYPEDEKPGLNTQNAWQLAGLPWSEEHLPNLAWQRILSQ